MATTTTNFGWTVPQSTDLVKDGATAISTLGSGIDTSLVDLKGGTTGQVLSKASGTDLDFTWVAQDDSNAIQNAIVDAKGDLIAATAADTPARLAIGTNGQILTADSAEATGMKWANSSSGGMTLISQTVASGLSSLSFGSISGSYTDLYLVWEGIGHNANGSSFDIRLNNSSSSIYNQRCSYWAVGTHTNGEGNDTSIGAGTFSPFGFSSTDTDILYTSRGWLKVSNYSSSTKAKGVSGAWSFSKSGVGGFSIDSYNGIYNSTSAITSLDIVRTAGSATFSNITNTTIRLYGVK